MSNQWNLKPCPFCGSDEEERFDITENKSWAGTKWSPPISYVLYHWCKGFNSRIELRALTKQTLLDYWNNSVDRD